MVSQCWRLDQVTDGSGDGGEWQWVKAEPMDEPHRAGGSVFNVDDDWWAIPENSHETVLYDVSSGQWGPGPDFFIEDYTRSDFCVAQVLLTSISCTYHWKKIKNLAQFHTHLCGSWQLLWILL